MLYIHSQNLKDAPDKQALLFFVSHFTECVYYKHKPCINIVKAGSYYKPVYFSLDTNA